MRGSLGLASYALSAGGTSGFSLLVLSAPLPSPQTFVGEGNTFLVAVTNRVSNAPLLVELRSVWTDLNGVSTTTPVIPRYISNTATFGGAALQASPQTLLLSGTHAQIVYPAAAGTAVQVWLLAASSIADNAGCSGAVALWAL